MAFAEQMTDEGFPDARPVTAIRGARRLGAPSAGATCGRPLIEDAPLAGRACPAGAPISSRRNGGKEGPGGSAHPGPPNPGVHGGGGLYRQGKDQPCIAARSLGIYVTGAAAPRVARIAVTLQALGAGALYQLGPPGRRRCHASEIPWRSRQLSVGRDDPARRPWGTGPTQNAETPCGIYAARPAQPLSSFAG